MSLNAFIPHGLPQEINEIIINFVNTPHPCVKIINDFWENQRKIMKTSYALQAPTFGSFDWDGHIYEYLQEELPNFNYLNIDNYADYFEKLFICSHNKAGWRRFTKKNKGNNRYAEVHDAIFINDDKYYSCNWFGSIPKNYLNHCETLP